MKKVFYFILFSLLSFAEDGLFPHQIFINNKPVVKIEELNEPIKIEASGLKMEIDPIGSITILKDEDWIHLRINTNGSVFLSSSLPLSFSPKRAKREIVGINELSLTETLSSGTIGLILKDGMNLKKTDMLIFPLVWKVAKKGYHIMSKDKEIINITK